LVKQIQNNDVIEVYTDVTSLGFQEQFGILEETVVNALQAHVESTLMLMASTLSVSSYEYLRRYAFNSPYR
jgi:hypothetical protein